MQTKENEPWLYEIAAKNKLVELNFKEIWRYRDLLILFVKRDITTVYKQTILGPLWFFIQPLFTSIIFTLVFNNIANIPTGGIPSFLFNLTGITAWNYFTDCLNKTSGTFVSNQGIFGKVYFPRAIMPLSVVISNLLKYGIQLLILSCFYIYYIIQGYSIAPNWNLLLFPLYVIIMAMLGLGLGMIISAMTTKYRDMKILVGFGVSLLMYISAVPYPLSEIKAKQHPYTWVIEYNPLTHIIEGFRYMMLDTGIFSWTGLIATFIFTIIVFLMGLVIFNYTEKSFIDTV
jgi:lipopolysaccharide transport system permease protein